MFTKIIYFRIKYFAMIFKHYVFQDWWTNEFSYNFCGLFNFQIKLIKVIIYQIISQKEIQFVCIYFLVLKRLPILNYFLKAISLKSVHWFTSVFIITAKEDYGYDARNAWFWLSMQPAALWRRAGCGHRVDCILFSFGSQPCIIASLIAHARKKDSIAQYVIFLRAMNYKNIIAILESRSAFWTATGKYVNLIQWEFRTNLSASSTWIFNFLHPRLFFYQICLDT